MIQICIRDKNGKPVEISLATLLGCITDELMKDSQDGEVSIAVRQLILEIARAMAE